MYNKILVPIDGSATSMRGLQEAIKLAKQEGATLRLVHVVNELILFGIEGPPMVYSDLLQSLRETGNSTLKKAEAVVREHGIEPQGIILEAVGGRAADHIVEEAKQWAADLIVMGTHGRRGMSRLAMGSDAELVLRSATVPVLMVRAE